MRSLPNESKILKIIHRNTVGYLPYFFSLHLSIIMTWIMLFIVISPFTDTSMTSNAFVNAFLLSSLLPIGIVLLIGRWVFYHKLVRRFIQLGLSIASSILFLLILYDLGLGGFTDFIGGPLSVQWGYYYSYSFYKPMALLGLIMTQGLISFLEFEQKSKIQSRQNSILAKKKEKIIGFCLVACFGLLWLQFIIALNFGVQLVFLLQNSFYGINSALILVNIVQKIIRPKRTISNMPSTSNREDGVADNVTNKDPDAVSGENPKSAMSLFNLFVRGISKTLQSIALLFILVLLLFLNFQYLDQVTTQPNYLPHWTQILPIMMVAIIFWVYIWKFVKNHVIITLCIMLMDLFTLIYYAYDPESVLYSALLYMVVGSIGITGIYMVLFSLIQHRTEGRFNRIFRTSIIFTGIALSYVLAAFYSLDKYTDELYIYGIPILLGFLMLLVLKVVAEKFLKKSNKVKNILPSSKQPKKAPVTETKSELDPSPMNKRKAIIVACLSFAIVYSIAIPGLSYSIIAFNSTEQVIGTFEGDYYLWYADTLRSIDIGYRPNFVQSPVNSTVSVTLARGEHEGFQVVFTPYNVKNLNLWSFAPTTDFIGKTVAHNLTSEYLNVYSVDYVDQLNNQYPDTLYPFKHLDTAFTLFGQYNYPFYIDIGIPAQELIPAGIYELEMKFHCRDFHTETPDQEDGYHVRDVKFKIQLEILNFTVTTERHIGAEIIWHIPDDNDWVNFYGDYRLDPYYPLQPATSYNSTAGNISIVFDWEKWSEDLEKCFDLGMKYFPVTWMPSGFNWTDQTYTQTFETLLTYYIENITDHLAGNFTPWGTPYIDHAYFFIIDEPPEAYDEMIIDIAQIIHGINPNLKIMETMNRPLETYSDEFLEEVDIYCQYIHHWEPSVHYPGDESMVPNAWPQRLNDFIDLYSGPREKVLWVYLTHNRFPTPDTDIYMSGIMQRNSFWMYWTYGITGWLYWSFNWGLDTDTGYGYAGYGESTLVGYDTGDKPLSSIRLERVRDGIEDFEYFWLLNDTCVRLESIGQSSKTVNARNLLKQVDLMFNQPQHLQSTINLDPDDEGYLWSYYPFSDRYLELRLLVGREIAALLPLLP